MKTRTILINAGQKALQAHFCYRHSENAIPTELLFPNEALDLTKTQMAGHPKQTDPAATNYFSVWSASLGLQELRLKQGQTIRKGILRILNKLQKENAPLFVIVTSTIDSVPVRYGYTLTEEQSRDIEKILSASAEKRKEKLSMLEGAASTLAGGVRDFN